MNRTQFLPRMLLGIAGLTAILIYFPGLAGSFTYDDSGVLTNNPAIRVDVLDSQVWLAAVASFGGDGMHSRWLGMLTFAINHYLTGMDPFWFKATNLAIHLANGLLLYLALKALFEFRALACRTPTTPTTNTALSAAVIAAIWLVLPINLTGVLYISQRLETFAHTLVFLGLWWYLRARIALLLGTGGSFGLWGSLIVCSLIGLQIKEPAALLPLFAFCVEFACTGFRKTDGHWNRPVIALYLALLALPMIAGLAWLGNGSLTSNDPMRGIDPMQRFLTEARIMFEYMQWTLVPRLDLLTFYHDDISVSKSLFSPLSTVTAVVGIFLLLAVSVWQRARRPMLALGILWLGLQEVVWVI